MIDVDIDIDDPHKIPGPSSSKKVQQNGGNTLLTENIKPRSDLPPLLVNLSDRRPEHLHYLGTSFGLTHHLFSFWSKNGYKPVYLRQTPSDVTGEHSVLMMKPLRSEDVNNPQWLNPFVGDFKQRFLSLLNGPFREMELSLALTILAPKLSYSELESQEGIKIGVTVSGVDGKTLSIYDLKRLQSYGNNVIDYHMIMDLVPCLARSYFSGCVPASVSYAQAAILLCLGLQQRTVSDVEKVLGLPSNQVLALFCKLIRKLHSYLHAVKAKSISRALPKPKPLGMQPQGSQDTKVDDAVNKVRSELAADKVQNYAIGDLAEIEGAVPTSGQLVSLKHTEGAQGKKPNGKRNQHGGEKKHAKKSGKKRKH